MRIDVPAGLILGCALTSAAAQDWPVKPVRIINPTAVGGVLDVMARVAAQRLTVATGQSFVVDNRPGANGIIGVELVAKSAPDGYTLLAGTNGQLVMNSAVFPKLPFSATRDFAPITIAFAAPFGLFAHPSLPVRSAKDLVALAKARPGQIPFGSFGPASVAHFAMELFMLKTGTQMTHVPYKGGGPMATAVVAGEVTVVFDSFQNQHPFVTARRIRPLAVAGPSRLKIAPDLPTLAEAGITGAEAGGWYALLAPAGTPRAIVTRVYDEVAATFKTAEMRERYEALGSEIILNSPDQFAAQIRSEIDVWTKVARNAGVKPN